MPRGFATAVRVLVGVVVGLALAYGASRFYQRHTAAAGTSDVTATGFPVQDLGAAPDLAGFVDQQGKPFDPGGLAGKVLVVSFLDPRGTRVSPVIAVNLLMALKSDLQDAGQFGGKVAFVSIDVDPRPLGPEPTAAFMKQVVGYGQTPAPASEWPFLSAPWATVEQVVRQGYGVPLERLTPQAFAAYAARRKASGTFFYARAWNPLAVPNAPIVVGNAQIVIVGPHGHIRARIARAYQVSSVAVQQTIEAVLTKANP
jgi:cytochrome oxidase Cu insertion factor (SCO1/SenC/PrrC family)